VKELTLDVPGLPDSLEAFLALRDQLATTVHGGAVMFVVAQAVYADDEELGRQLLTIAVDRGVLYDGPKGYKGKQLSNMELQAFRERIRGKPYVARSYFQGTSPENGYALPAGGLQVNVREQPRDVEAERGKVFVHSTGADSPRPIVLLKNNRGLWKAKTWSSLQVGVRPPVEVVDDDF
jgi:hypothetical protein